VTQQAEREGGGLQPLRGAGACAEGGVHDERGGEGEVLRGGDEGGEGCWG
jgi:hypothetical protein